MFVELNKLQGDFDLYMTGVLARVPEEPTATSIASIDRVCCILHGDKLFDGRGGHGFFMDKISERFESQTVFICF